jgi:hypothetical protein
MNTTDIDDTTRSYQCRLRTMHVRWIESFTHEDYQQADSLLARIIRPKWDNRGLTTEDYVFLLTQRLLTSLLNSRPSDAQERILDINRVVIDQKTYQETVVRAHINMAHAAVYHHLGLLDSAISRYREASEEYLQRNDDEQRYMYVWAMAELGTAFLDYS